VNIHRIFEESCNRFADRTVRATRIVWILLIFVCLIDELPAFAYYLPLWRNSHRRRSMKRTSEAVLIFCVMLITAAAVQAQMGPPTPAPELKKLDFLAGDWTAEGTVNPGPGMPGGKFTEATHAQWMEGNFFLIEHSDADMAGMGKFKEYAVLGYDTEKKVYTYTAFNSMGRDE